MKTSQLKKYIELMVERKLNERGIITEKFNSPILNDLWRLIKKMNYNSQKSFLTTLRRPSILGPVAWDKIPPEAVEKISPQEAMGRKNAINLWCTTKKAATGGDRKYDNSPIVPGIYSKYSNPISGPILAVTQGKKAVWVNDDTKMGGALEAGEAFRDIIPATEFVVSIDMAGVSSTVGDVKDKVAKRAEQKANRLEREYGRAARRVYIKDKDSKYGGSYFTKDAYRYVANANKARYKAIIADRISKSGTEEADKLIKAAMKVSEEITRKFVAEKPLQGEPSVWGKRDATFRYGIDPASMMNTMQNCFRYYQYVLEYHDAIQSGNDRDYYKREMKQSLDYLKRYTNEMLQIKKKVDKAV